MHFNTGPVQRLRLFLLAYLVPGLVLYSCYVFFVYSKRELIFGRLHDTRYFRTDFIFGRLDPPLRDPDLIVLGGSGTKMGIAPLRMRSTYAVNLSDFFGNAMSAYHTMAVYLETRKPPPCMALISHFEWQRTYVDFFSSHIREGGLSFKEVMNIWSEGRRYDIYPATKFGFTEFWLRYALESAYLYDLNFPKLQLAMRELFNRTAPRDRAGYLESGRGYIGRGLQPAITDFTFTGAEVNATFTRDFVPSATEEHYLRKLAALAAQNNIQLFIGTLPLPESEISDNGATFRLQRDKFLRNALAGNKDVHFLTYPDSLPRDKFLNFTHPNFRGAVYLTTELEKQIQASCYSGE